MVRSAPLGIIWLRIRRFAEPANVTYSPFAMYRPWKAPASEVIGRSDFFWIGNYYSIIGDKADLKTDQWWKSLRNRIAKVAVQIPSTGPIDRKPKEIWAFPQALEKIRAGMHPYITFPASNLILDSEPFLARFYPPLKKGTWLNSAPWH